MGKWLVALFLLLLVSLAAAPAGAVRFIDAGATMNIPPAIGGAWGDYDSDGYPDLYVDALWGNHRAVLYHNNWDGTFTDVTAAMGLRTESSAWEDWGAAWGDFNNDGALDLVVVGGNHPVFLYRNDGDHFTDIGGAAGGFPYSATQRGVAWGDYDGDNWLDLYICYELSNVSRLYRNNRDGTFTEVTNEAGMEFSPAGLGIGASWADYDGDGLLDLMVTRMQNPSGDLNPPRLYHNNGDGTFSDAGEAAGLADGSTNGLAWGDYDNDGLVDLYLGGNENRSSFLYHNNGDGTFADVYATAIGSTSDNAVGVAWADYDNDGFLDLAQVNSRLPQYSSLRGLPFLFHNEGDGTFAEQAGAEGMTDSRYFRTASWADYDLDGRMDLFAASDQPDYSVLYHNGGSAADGTWLRVRALTSETGDATDGSPVRDALGARVSVNLDNDPAFPPGRTLLRTIDGGSSFMGQNEQVAQFGLGDATTVAVRVVFPDYSVITQADVAAGQQIEVRDTLQETGSLEGTITAEADGAAIYNAAVTCGHLTTRSSLTGVYRFPFVPSGVYEVAVAAEGYAPQTAAAVVVAGGGTTTRDFALDPAPGAIEGHITDAVTSAVVAGATVTAGGETATTEADGHYLLSGLAPGSYTVTATAAGYQEASHSGAVVVSGETTMVDLALTPLSIGAVHGVVREATTTSPIAGAVVTCGPMRVLTNSSGAYSFPAVTAGSYTLGAAAGGHWWSAGVTVEVEAGETVAQDFALARIGGAGPQFDEIDGGIGMPACLGAAWGDYTGDGRPDLFLAVDENAPFGVALFQNSGDLTFTDITTAVGLPNTPDHYDGVAAGDYDNDGDLDVFVSGESPVSVQLFRNDEGSFVEVAADAGIAWDWGARTVSWTDYDADNWLDVIVGNPGGAPPLYHNDADGGFTDVTADMGIGASSSNWGSVIWADFDNDGWLDAIGSWGYAAPPHFSHNDEGAGFTEVPSAFSSPPNSPASVAAGDFDNDGWIDVAFGNWPYSQGVQLFRNQRDGTFANVSAAAGIGGEGSWIDAVSWADYDNDGFLDLYASVSLMPVALYHNNGNGAFTNVASDAGLICPNQNTAAVWGDLDLDGRIDLFQGSTSASHLFHNTGTAGNWLRVRALTDRDGAATDQDLSDDRDAIGARVELNVDNDGSFPPGRTLTRVVSGGSGFLGQDEPIAQFGVPVDSSVAVRVTFPDGSVVVRRGLALNQQLAIRDKLPEPSSSFWDVPSDSWALAAIEAAVEAGVVQGYWDNTYHPERVVTRDQMAVYIARALAGGDGNVPSGTAEPTFTDVAADHWAYRYVEYCAGLDIVQGYWDGYHPGEVVNRGQMAVYIARAVATPVGEAGVPEAGATPTFPDVTADNDWSWCYKHVEYVADLGIVQGYWDGYHPEREVTRDQMAVYVARAFELLD